MRNLLVCLIFLVLMQAAEEIRGSVFGEPRFYDCVGKKRLIYKEFCDGNKQCPGGEDESVAVNSSAQFNPYGRWQRCHNPKNSFDGFCLVHRDQICNGEVLCSNLSPCDLNCDSHYRCNNGSCRLRKTVCDQDPCSGCDEDHGWSNGVGFKCARNGYKCILPQQLLYDNVSDCDGGADLCFAYSSSIATSNSVSGADFVNKKCFRCLDGKMIVSTSSVCDGVIDCSDMSDECICTSGAPKICNQLITSNEEAAILSSRGLSLNETDGHCEVGNIKCTNGKCIKKEAICDGIKDCDEDESFDLCRGTIACKDATKREKCRCELDRQDKHCRATSATACDGIGECPPKQLHGWQIWTLETYPEDECNATCTANPSSFTCKRTESIHYRKKLSGTWCTIPDDIELPDVYTRDIEGWQYCDGIVDCELSGSDEDTCKEFDCRDYDCVRFHCNTTRQGYVSIREDQVCDGILDCIDGKDEDVAQCGAANGQLKHVCPSLNGKMVNIDGKFLCDSVINCDDASDELNCNDGRFYCENGELPIFVMRSQVKDGKADCSDWSDECPTLNGSTIQNVFSSRYEMISHPSLRVLVWIMGLLAAVGNIAVIIHESKKLRAPQKRTTHAIRANRIMILNLACADFLMGIYLLSLAVIAVKMQGNYCAKDIEWRTSSFCTSLGILAVISGEASVMTMVILTGCRLYAVLKPFDTSSRPSRRVLICLILSTWVSSLILAFLPISLHLTHVFIAGVDFVFNPFVTGTQVSLNTTKDVFLKASSYHQLNSSQTEVLQAFVLDANWKDIQEKGNSLGINYFEPKTIWGYYSAASVCIPKFFITTDDPAWVYSFIVTLFNILAFAFIATSYSIIYVTTRRNSTLIQGSSPDEDKMRTMQRKILRLVMTDFVCWVPICIMGFVKLAGAEVSDNAYLYSAIILMPLNSALNPILYSSMLDSMISRFQGFINNLRRKNSSAKPSSDEKSEKFGVMMQVIDQSTRLTPEVSKKTKEPNTESKESNPTSRDDIIEEAPQLV